MESDKVNNASQDGASDGVPKRPPHGRTTGPTRRSTKGQWTTDEDDILCKAVQRYKGKNWKKIAECFKDRTDVQCLHRWQKVLNPNLVKGPWSKEEDEIIVELVEKYGAKKWSTIAQHLTGRIGKQCRERWHNHLNPAINKEAWTQEEELKLIRAHMTYGNKWAELTKYLPGRSDNSIKNHWNSSVKKKLDSYITSGLVTEFLALPHNQIIPSSSSNTQQSSDNGCLPKTETLSEDISECSQGSTVVGCSQDTSGMTNIILHAGNDYCQGNAVSSPQQYYKVEEGEFDNPEMLCEVGCSYFEQDFSHETGTSANQDYNFNLQELREMSSMELDQGIQVNMKDECVPASLQDPLGTEASTSIGNIVMGSNQLDHMMLSESNHCRAMYEEEATHGRTSSGNFQVCENAESFASQPYYPVRSDIEIPLLCSSDYRMYGNNLNHLHSLPVGNEEYLFDTRTNGDFIFTDDSAIIPYDNDAGNNINLQEQNDHINHSIDLVPVDSPTNSNPLVVETEEQNVGSLCYEPPRFPSLEVPFFSCDLIQSGSDMQQEFSPLGIRQLMLNCLTPFRSWESPSRDGSSPVAVLKSAAKTFNSTPAIIKKRHRDLLSPLSDRRSGKKIGRDFTQRTLSGLARNFSNLDVMFDDHPISPPSAHKRSLEPSIDKENFDNPFKGGNAGGGTEFGSSNSEEKKEKGILGTNANNQVAVEGTYRNPTGVLLEHDMNNLQLFSPKAEREQASSSENPSASGKTLDEYIVEVASIEDAPSSTPLRILVDNAKYGVGIENVAISGETPFKRCIQSPSAWISPRFLNSFLPGPRVDTEISIEDIEYLLSPGNASIDAIGLMKQLSEHSAATFADAREVLRNDSSERLLKERKSNSPNQDRSHLASDILPERCTLDFGECGTPPGKSKNNGKSTNITSSSSPSSYLLKSCR